MARSIDPVYPTDHAITRVTQTKQADIDKGERTEMGGKWTVAYGLYRVEVLLLREPRPPNGPSMPPTWNCCTGPWK